MVGLKDKKCVPCEGGIPKLSAREAQKLLQELREWRLEGERLRKLFKFKNFVKAIEFINQMAHVAEAEGHHPDFCVHYREVDVTIWTHAIDGLSENDFILAAKLDALLPPS
jgi:4a-hydroxytetrahydrobiopterin dehydratase